MVIYPDFSMTHPVETENNEMEKRNRFFSFLKGKKKTSTEQNDKGVLLGFGGGSITAIDEWAREANSTYENCITCLAKHISKIKPVAYFKDELKDRSGRLNRILNLRPNPLQTASEFYYAIADCYFRTGIAVAHLVYDNEMNLTAMVPLDISLMEVKKSTTGDTVWLTLSEGDGTTTRDIIENFVILIRKANCSNPFLTKDKSIEKIVAALNSNTDSFVKAVTESHFIRYIAKMATVTDASKKAAMRQDFEEQLEKDKNGLLIIPGVLDFQQVNTNQGTYAKQPEMDDFRDEVFSHFGLTKDFVKGKFTENEFQAVYENTLEPFINDLRQELTYKLFTIKEIGHGNEIRIETSPLQTASLTTRIQLAQAIMSCGMYKPNDVMRLLYQEPIDGGDKVVQSLNYVDSEQANKYQTGQDGGDEPNSEQEKDNTDDKAEENQPEKGEEENGN